MSNPIWAWGAISIADEHGVESPEWVREYFSGIATAIEYDTETKSESRNETDAERFGKIAGFKGSRGCIGAWRQVRIWRRKPLFDPEKIPGWLARFEREPVRIGRRRRRIT